MRVAVDWSRTRVSVTRGGSCGAGRCERDAVDGAPASRRRRCGRAAESRSDRGGVDRHILDRPATVAQRRDRRPLSVTSIVRAADVDHRLLGGRRHIELLARLQRAEVQRRVGGIVYAQPDLIGRAPASPARWRRGRFRCRDGDRRGPARRRRRRRQSCRRRPEQVGAVPEADQDHDRERQTQPTIATPRDGTRAGSAVS